MDDSRTVAGDMSAVHVALILCQQPIAHLCQEQVIMILEIAQDTGEPAVSEQGCWVAVWA